MAGGGHEEMACLRHFEPEVKLIQSLGPDTPVSWNFPDGSDGLHLDIWRRKKKKESEVTPIKILNS